MNSLDARVIRGCRVREHVVDDVRALACLELAFCDGSWLTLGCAGDGAWLHLAPRRMRWTGVPERGNFEVHGRHALCVVLRPGTSLIAERAMADTAQRTTGVALATQYGRVYVFNRCGELQYAHEPPPEMAAILGAVPLGRP